MYPQALATTPLSLLNISERPPGTLICRLHAIAAQSQPPPYCRRMARMMVVKKKHTVQATVARSRLRSATVEPAAA